jgi:hypothetical protein
MRRALLSSVRDERASVARMCPSSPRHRVEGASSTMLPSAPAGKGRMLACVRRHRRVNGIPPAFHERSTRLPRSCRRDSVRGESWLGVAGGAVVMSSAGRGVIRRVPIILLVRRVPVSVSEIQMSRTTRLGGWIHRHVGRPARHAAARLRERGHPAREQHCAPRVMERAPRAGRHFFLELRGPFGATMREPPSA